MNRLLRWLNGRKYRIASTSFVVLLLPGGLIPDPVRNCAGQLVNKAGEIVRDIHPVSSDNRGRGRYCTIVVSPPLVDPKNRFRVYSDFSIQDPLWDDWGWYNNCAIAAAKVGKSVPIVKATGDGNEMGRTPVIRGIIPRPPLLHHGTIEWINLTTANVAVWRKGHLEAAARL